MYDMYPEMWIERIAERERVAPKRRPRKPRDLTPPSLRRAREAATVTHAA
ncbi:MAG: hypothetical protein GXX86_07095 [Propionibacterium sp.]|nr:hypothetical protein [Propionibacterium sp.]